VRFAREIRLRRVKDGFDFIVRRSRTISSEDKARRFHRERSERFHFLLILFIFGSYNSCCYCLVFGQGFFQRNPSLRTGEILLRNVKSPSAVNRFLFFQALSAFNQGTVP
jgi:hypothetical protein